MPPKTDKGKNKLVNPPKESPKRPASGQPRATSPSKKRTPSPEKAGPSSSNHSGGKVPTSGLKTHDTEKGSQDSKRQSTLDAIKMLHSSFINENAITRNELKECFRAMAQDLLKLSESVEDIKKEIKSFKKDE
jgi:hypothetical protein